ncbi:MAG: metal-dependent transcriptional regulator [Sphaerobacteraceae bacterium]|nr:MAG: metal-dependent transcriptional regulator [Sphaerobacteraceae bacterium]
MEDYLKIIFKLEEEGSSVTTQSIAERLQVQSPSVTNMVKRLADLNLVEHRPYKGVMLTVLGRKAALEVIRHHRLLELYLAEALGYSWDEVHEEADRLEHSISEEFEARIDRALGFPSVDPHGEPIPTAEGEIAAAVGLRLSELPEGSHAVVELVSDTDPEKLRYLGDLGLYPAADLTMVEHLPFDGPVKILVQETEHVIGRRLADTIMVRTRNASGA